MNVGLHRLSPFNVGRRRYAYPTLTQDDLAGVGTLSCADWGSTVEEPVGIDYIRLRIPVVGR